MRGVESSFRFVNFKIDRTVFETSHTVAFLNATRDVRSEDIQILMRLRNAGHVPESRTYVGGLDAKLESTLGEEPERQGFSLEMGITGLFHVEGDDLDNDTLDRLVRYQIPAILFPYLRASATSFLANAGFPGVFVPLINIHRLASDAKVEIVELKSHD
jgi:preprotein translocase subunit SecB